MSEENRTRPERKYIPLPEAFAVNLYLHWLDKRFHGKDGPARFAGAQLVRYADDFVILARYQGQRITDWVQSTKGNLGLYSTVLSG